MVIMIESTVFCISLLVSSFVWSTSAQGWNAMSPLALYRNIVVSVRLAKKQADLRDLG